MAESGWQRMGRRALLWLSLLWAGYWMLGGIGSALDPSYDQPLATGVGIALVVGVLPCLPLWVGRFKRFRQRRRGQRLHDERESVARARAESSRQRSQQMQRLPRAVRDDWERLEGSRRLVQEFADQGWIERSSLLEIDEHISRLRRLLEADERTDRLGGETSGTLRAQVGDLTALLIALADAAVEHQATLMTDHPVPVTLAEARDRLSTTAQAYRDLQQPG